MRYFHRRGPVIEIDLSDYEATLLSSLVEQYSGLLEADEPGNDPEDSFARWQAELAAEPPDRTDPVLERLFPDAYTDDEAASEEFRRFTHARQRADRLGHAEVVLSALADSGTGERKVQVRLVELDRWLKTLTGVRLSLAVRLGIEDEADAEELEELPEADPRSYLYRVYEWLAYLLENLLALA